MFQTPYDGTRGAIVPSDPILNENYFNAGSLPSGRISIKQKPSHKHSDESQLRHNQLMELGKKRLGFDDPDEL